MTWRPLPGGGSEPPPRTLADSLERLTRAWGAPPPRSLSTLFDRWQEIVGPVVAAHSRPMSLRERVLTIAVDDGAWGAQLGYLEADLLRQLAAALGPGAVERVVVRVQREGQARRGRKRGS